MDEYMNERLKTVPLSRPKRQRADDSSQADFKTEVDVTTDTFVSQVRTILPRETLWEEVVARRVTDSRTGEVIREWENVKSLSSDELHWKLIEPRILKIHYRLDPSLRSENQAKLDDSQCTALRGALAAIGWCSRQGNPVLAAAASVIASSFPTPQVVHAKQANKMVELAKELKIHMRLWSIPEDQLRRICIEDASFDPAAKDKSQHGWLIGFTTPDLAQGKPAPVSLVDWKSKKLRRKANSSLLCEAQSANISTGRWLALANLEMSLRFAGHRIGGPLAPKYNEEPTVLTRQAALRKDPHGLLVMDAKSLYDSINSSQCNQDESRSALEAFMVKEELEKLGALPRWIPHDKNPADALTKVHNAHIAPLVALLKDHMWTLTHEETELADRAKEKEEKGYNPRRHDIRPDKVSDEGGTKTEQRRPKGRPSRGHP
jgi:hypothetical protein